MWYNQTTRDIIKNVNQLESFKKVDPPDKYNKLLSSISKTNKKSSFDFNIFGDHNDCENDLIYSHKYKIKFNDTQTDKLKIYFDECKKVYDLCVDIYNDYNDMPTQWHILKDVLFRHLYREKKTDDIKEIKNKIISDLREIKKIYDLEREINQDKINELKQIAREKYKKEMDVYKKCMKDNRKSAIKTHVKKPKMDKIKIAKVKKPRKPNGIQIKKPAPDDTIKSEIEKFCKNLQDNLNKVHGDHTQFVMTHKYTQIKQTIKVSKRAIVSDGIFIRDLKKIEDKKYEQIINKYKINHDCELTYQKGTNVFYLHIPIDKKIIDIKNRKDLVALDPGEKIFMTYYSDNEYGQIADNMRIKILGIQREIKKLDSIISKKKNKNNRKIRNIKRLKKRRQLLFNRIKGYVNETHKKGVKYLCENYKTILIPTFETKPMISKNKIKKETERINKIDGKEKAREELKGLEKKIRLSNKVKFVLQMQSHYKFKEYLEATAKRYRTTVIIVDESYTSKTCCECGYMSDEYNYRTKECTKCKKKIDRDINGSRNIMLKVLTEKSGGIAR